MSTTATTTDLFVHIRIVIGIILGMGVTRLLSGVARFVQHPGRERIYLVHLGWVLSMLLTLVHFWWWEFWLFGITQWTFMMYLFLIGYAILLFLLCALLFPDDIAEYSGYEAFFISRRKWFFGILAITFVFDLFDTLLKGQEHFALYGIEYFIRTPAYVILCVVAMITPNRRFHAAFVIASLIYQISWILRLFETLA